MPQPRVPVPRKIKGLPHKSFGSHSRMVTQELVDAIDGLGYSRDELKGKRVGDKQVHPKAYKDGLSDPRRRAEIRNAEARREAQREDIGCCVCPFKNSKPCSHCSDCAYL